MWAADRPEVSIVFLHQRSGPRHRARRTTARKLSTALSLGWQARPSGATTKRLPSLATPLVLSVHSVVSWDFAVSIVPGWHATIFAPYFSRARSSRLRDGADGDDPLRRICGLRHHRLPLRQHGPLLLLLADRRLLYRRCFVAWYSGVEFEASFWLRVRAYWFSTWTMIICR
jgi:molybdopterin-containing oxidoreductase family membrane subunit